MTLKLMYITNNEQIAILAESCGVDWIFVDLEIVGKVERQGHLNSVISRHKISDVKRIRSVIKESELMVRVNPIHGGSKDEINKVIELGADILMLPYFKTAEEVQTFMNIVDGRTETCLLLETSEAVEQLESILEISGIHYIHIGLNDLHLCYGMEFIFELLADGTIESICSKIARKGIPYGFGGIARLGHGALPAEKIVAEHYRLKSSMAILSRSFCDLESQKNFSEVEKIFSSGIKEIRNFERQLRSKTEAYFQKNKEEITQRVSDIVYAQKTSTVT